MANRSFRNVSYSYDPGLITLCGGFVTNTASNPATFQGPYGLAAAGPAGQSNLPNGVSAITHSGTGEYTLTFVDNFFALMYAGVDLAMGTAANSFAQFNGFTNLNSSSTLTAKITTITGGAAADIATGSNTNIVSFCFIFKNTSAV